MPNSLPNTTPTPPPPSPLPHSRFARSHNRRFHVRFPGVDSEEHLLNYYSCALVADILLQGHLYITENFFAFYSNIFGRKTQTCLTCCSCDFHAYWQPTGTFCYMVFGHSCYTGQTCFCLGLRDHFRLWFFFGPSFFFCPARVQNLFGCHAHILMESIICIFMMMQTITMYINKNILLPVSDVIKVTKERTAKIIPNAVGLYTVEGKYVFGSLLSRNTTYRLMHHVWLKSADPDTTEEEPSATEASEPATSDEALVEEPVPPALEEAVVNNRRMSRRKSELFPRISAQAAARRQANVPPPVSPDSPAIVEQITLSKCGWDCTKTRECFTRLDDNVQSVNNGSLPRSTLLLLAATLLLVMLFLLATVLVYRVSIATSKTVAEDGWPIRSGHRLTNYLELLKQQQEAVEEEIMRITSTLKNRLNDLRQVKQSIDQLSSITRRTTCSSAKETPVEEN